MYIPHKIGSGYLYAKRNFDLFFCQIEKIPFGCKTNITYLTV